MAQFCGHYRLTDRDSSHDCLVNVVLKYEQKYFHQKKLMVLCNAGTPELYCLSIGNHHLNSDLTFVDL
jgi:hypothetical protein